MILPTLTLAIGIAGQYVVLMRSAVDRHARRRTSSRPRARSACRASACCGATPSERAPPGRDAVALNLGFVVGGAITVEALFSWPGIGPLTIQAIDFKDFPMLQGISCSRPAVIVLNLTADILYTYLDPRVRTDCGRRAHERRDVTPRGFRERWRSPAARAEAAALTGRARAWSASAS